MKISFLTLLVLILANGNNPEVYQFSFFDMDGNTIHMETYRQKKIVIANMPVIQSAESDQYLIRLDSLSRANSAIVMIGIPAFEDGYTDQDLVSIKNYYKSRIGNQFVLAKGMHTRKGVPNQHPLYKWLTFKEQNLHFDQDTEGVGQQFYISENGELYGVLSPELRWNNKIFNRLVK